ncbi:2-octaprenyl-6-methoxyphenyl hydroxylase [Imhoffiella purpurea]|uniref:2-octaprenyl-6-methoxyphenol hydroxylase n=1 Tax=Imhoffiella purpurea TaxID=1249627 RepID=W9VAE2_9GAMM|nr:2-octaprenyl-6-methoxyphenyl hydroxylase [Imhoffiella purpurea]EXJ16399.1 2-octaprenyl-6-methoxyphenol hydroxylase [Imhoffiella purpurea]
MYQYDVTIVGGGLVGGSLACALADTGLKVALIEAVSPQSHVQPSYDERVIALSLGSQRIFRAIGVWSEMVPEAEPILRVHVSDRGHCAFTRLDHAEEGVEALGYVIPARSIGSAIQIGLEYANNLEIFRPAQLLAHRVCGDGVDLSLRADGEMVDLRTRLLVAADGGHSGIREGLDLKVSEHDYGQDAVIATVTPDRPQRGVAFERFTDSGPLAMLPMTADRYSVVWTCRESETQELLSLDDDDFLGRLQARFGFRLGRLGQVSARRVYPLKFLLTRDSVQDRVVLIGNSAHTLHPVAGQGFNLGLRDVAGLADVLADCAVDGRDPGAPETLAGYSRWRTRDQKATAGLTDALVRLFTPDWTPLIMARAAGMLGVDLLPCARHRLARRFMGLGGRQPRLASGLSLGGGRHE